MFHSPTFPPSVDNISCWGFVTDGGFNNYGDITEDKMNKQLKYVLNMFGVYIITWSMLCLIIDDFFILLFFLAALIIPYYINMKLILKVYNETD